MGKIVISENVSLDGVVEDPTGEEGTTFGGWFARIGDADREAWAKIELDEAMAAAALLLGGRSYMWFAARWVSRSGEWADRLRSLRKYVVSSTVGDLGWGDTVLLSGDMVGAVSALREQVEGDIVVYGSATLAHTLMEHDLVDELRLTVYPFVLGAGRRLFGETSATKSLCLVDSRTVGDGLSFLTYRVVRDG